MPDDTPFHAHLSVGSSPQISELLPTSPRAASLVSQELAPGPSGTHLPRHKEQKWRLLLFGFVLGNDLLGYWLDQLLGCLRFPIILRICNGERETQEALVCGTDGVAPPEGAGSWAETPIWAAPEWEQNFPWDTGLAPGYRRACPQRLRTTAPCSRSNYSPRRVSLIPQAPRLFPANSAQTGLGS